MIPTECPIAMAANEEPDATAICRGNRLISYAELDSIVEQQARLLPFAPGTRVCFQPDQSIHQVAFYWAIFRRRAIACPISSRISKENAQSLCHQVGGEMMVVRDFAKASSTMPEPSASQPGKMGPALDALATIIFSSGTTSKPKAVVHDFQAHLLNAIGANENIPLSRHDAWLLTLPTYHVGGLAVLFRCAIARACVAIPSETDSFVDATAERHVTHVSVVTTQLQRLLDSGKPFEHLKAILLGGSAFSTRLVEQACRRLLPLHTTYGLTEMASQVTTSQRRSTPEDHSGQPLNHRKLSIAPRWRDSRCWPNLVSRLLGRGWR